tara:strand:- start:233 stop:1174 length:942 start_codon:yes stop_codon:yes gene_type:complete
MVLAFTNEDNNREKYIANQGIRAVNAARDFSNTYGNKSWAMSQPKEFYLNRDNLSQIKDTLVNTPAVTTDQNETRNMYQMLMNQIRGGGGAQMIDTSGLPAGARRYGRTLFTDPSKSQGFFGDVKSLFTGKNKAAMRAPTVNYFGNFGKEGKDFYKKEFPIANFMQNAMSTAGNFIPYANMIKKVLPKKKRKLIDRTLLPVSGIVPLLPEYQIDDFEESIESTAGDGITTDRIIDVATRSPEFEYESAATEEVTEIPTDTAINQAYNYLYGKEIYEFGAPISLEEFKKSYGDDINYINGVLKTKEAAEEMGLI